MSERRLVTDAEASRVRAVLEPTGYAATIMDVSLFALLDTREALMEALDRALRDSVALHEQAGAATDCRALSEGKHLLSQLRGEA